MVVRSLDLPCAIISGTTVSRIKSIQAEWVCSQCAKSQTLGKKPTPCYVRMQHDKSGRRKYLCLQCALNLLHDELLALQTIKAIGFEAYLLAKDI